MDNDEQNYCPDNVSGIHAKIVLVTARVICFPQTTEQPKNFLTADRV